MAEAVSTSEARLAVLPHHVAGVAEHRFTGPFAVKAISAATRDAPLLKFLANILEQLDLALEHATKGDANNARFALMLTDNAVELTLHQIAADKKRSIEIWSRRGREEAPSAPLLAALGQDFRAKVRYAQSLNMLAAEEADTVSVLHGYRNEVYHIGVQHDAILPELAVFYFASAARVLAGYEPAWLGWSSNLELPERAKKYLHEKGIMPGSTNNYREGCLHMAKAVNFQPGYFIGTLAQHMEDVIDQQSIAIDTIATDGPNRMGRDEAVLQTQAWATAFTDEGKAFGRDNNWSGGTHFEFVDWIAATHPKFVRRDPIPDWEKRLASLRSEKNPYRALRRYRDFMAQTERLRTLLDDAHAQVEDYIDQQIEMLKADRRAARND